MAEASSIHNALVPCGHRTWCSDCLQGKAINFEDYSDAGSISAASALSSLSTPSLTELRLHERTEGSTTPPNQPSAQSSPTMSTGMHTTAPHPAAQGDGEHKRGVMSKLRSWRGKQGDGKENGRGSKSHGRKGRRMSKLLGCFATPPLTTEHRGVV